MRKKVGKVKDAIDAPVAHGANVAGYREKLEAVGAKMCDDFLNNVRRNEWEIMAAIEIYRALDEINTPKGV